MDIPASMANTPDALSVAESLVHPVVMTGSNFPEKGSDVFQKFVGMLQTRLCEKTS